MSKIVALRNKTKDEFESRYGTKLTYMPFFVKAVVNGLRAYPTLNASLDGTNVILHKEINIGMAVALDWGLIVPVIKNADEKNVLGIQRTMNDLAERARSKKLKPEEVQEGTFSITNPGVFGGLFGLPVISQPNVGILGLGAIEKRPVVINDSIAIRSMCYVTSELRSSRGRWRSRTPVPAQGEGNARELVGTAGVSCFETRCRFSI